MKKNLKKALAALLTALILMSTALCAVSAQAEVTGAETGMIEARYIPHNDKKDTDETSYPDEIIDEDRELVKKIGDGIITAGKGLIPFGDTIVNFFRSRAGGQSGADLAKNVVDLASDAANFVSPVVGPLASVAKDIANKVIDWFR